MISIVIGSWGSYNECNERALGVNGLTSPIIRIGKKLKKPLKSKALN